MTMNMMIAGSILNFLLGGLTSDSKPSMREGGSDNFDSLIKQLLLNAEETNSAVNSRKLKTSETGGRRTGVYLKAFNSGLAAKGKSLDKACLESNDINMLTDFLLQCGYTEADAKQFIGKLVEKHPDGMIPLSEFFSQVAAPELSGKRPYPSIIIDPSVTPVVDSLLKDFGLTLEEADHTLNAARSADGGLDLDKLIAQLKVVRDQMRGEKRGTVEGIASVKVSKKLEELGIQTQSAPAVGSISMDDLVTGLERLKDHNLSGAHATGRGENHGAVEDIASVKVSKKLEELGIQIQSGQAAGRISMDGIITGLEQLKDHNLSGARTTGRGYDGQLPLNIKSSLDRIIEKAVAGDEKLELQLAAPSILQLKSASSTGKKETNGSGYDTEGDRKTESGKKNGKPSVNEGSRSVEAGRHEKLDRISDLNEGSGHKKEMNPETDRGGLKTKSAEILQDGGTPSVRFETLSSIPRNRQADNSFFPEHIVDQLGRQISKSISRGDRIINLQLNPPELGSVKLSMEIKGNTLQLGMITESSSIKEIMLANAHELKAALLDQGIKLDRLDVQVGQNFGRSLMNLNEGSGQEHQQYQETDGNLFSDNDIQEDVLPNPRSMAGRDYLLDLKA